MIINYILFSKTKNSKQVLYAYQQLRYMVEEPLLQEKPKTGKKSLSDVFATSRQQEATVQPQESSPSINQQEPQPTSIPLPQSPGMQQEPSLSSPGIIPQETSAPLSQAQEPSLSSPGIIPQETSAPLSQAQDNESILVKLIAKYRLSDQEKARYLKQAAEEQMRKSNATTKEYERAANTPDVVIQENYRHPLVSVLNHTMDVMGASITTAADKVGIMVEKSAALTTQWKDVLTKYDNLLERIKNYNPWSFKTIALTTAGLITAGFTVKMLLARQVPETAANLLGDVVSGLKDTAKKTVKEPEVAKTFFDASKELIKEHPLAMTGIAVAGIALTGFGLLGVGSYRMATRLISMALRK